MNTTGFSSVTTSTFTSEGQITPNLPKPKPKLAASSTQSAVAQVLTTMFHLPANYDSTSYRNRIRQIPYLDLAFIDRTSSPDIFLKSLHMQESPSMPLTSEDIIQFYDMVDAHPMSDFMRLYTLFELELFDLFHKLKVDGNLSDIPSWKNFEKYCLRVYMEGLYMLNKPIAADKKLAFIKKLSGIPDFAKKILPGIFKDLCEQEYKQYEKNDVSHNSFKTSWENWINCHKLLAKFFAQDQCQRLLYGAKLGLCPGIMKTLRCEPQYCGEQLNKFVSFMSITLTAMPQETTQPVLIYIFSDISKKINLLTFESPEQWHELVKLLMNGFLTLNSNGNIFKASNPPDTVNPYVIAISSLRECLNTIQSSILPALDSTYKHSHLFEKRLISNIIHLEIFLKKFNPKKSKKKANVLKKINRKFFAEISRFQSDIQVIKGKYLFHKNFHKYVLSFIEKDVIALAEKVMPFIENFLPLLSDCAKVHRDQLKNKELLNETIYIARVFLIMHDIGVLLFNKSPWPNELPSEYIQFISLENEVEEAAPVDDKEDFTVLSEQEDAYSINENEGDFLEEVEEDLESDQEEVPSINENEGDFDEESEDYLHSNEEEDSSLSLKLNCAASLPKTLKISSSTNAKSFNLSTFSTLSSSYYEESNRTLIHSSAPSTSPERLEEKITTVRHLDRALRRLAGRAEGGSHAAYYPRNLKQKVMGPRHGKNVGRGLFCAIRRQVNAILDQPESQAMVTNPILSPACRPYEEEKKKKNKPKRR